MAKTPSSFYLFDFVVKTIDGTSRIWYCVFVVIIRYNKDEPIPDAWKQWAMGFDGTDSTQYRCMRCNVPIRVVRFRYYGVTKFARKNKFPMKPEYGRLNSCTAFCPSCRRYSESFPMAKEACLSLCETGLERETSENRMRRALMFGEHVEQYREQLLREIQAAARDEQETQSQEKNGCPKSQV